MRDNEQNALKSEKAWSGQRVKILLLYPPGKRLNYQMSIPCLSAFLKQHGINPEVLDAATLGLTPEETLARIEIINPGMIGVSIPFSLYAPAAYQLMDKVKEKFPNVIIISGGVHATLCAEETLQHCDFVVKGAGEQVLLELINHPPDERKLVIEGKPIELDLLPIPDWDCVSMKYDGKGYSGMPIPSSRGCPYKCNFCANWLLSKGKVSYRSVDKIIEEIAHYQKKYGATKFVFQDETFTMNKERVRELCEKMKPMGIRWICQTRAHLVDGETLKLMREAGCFNVSVGVESGNEEILAKIPKLETKEQIRFGVGKIKEAGLEVSAGFIIGHPWDTPETVMDTINFADELDVDIAGFALATPFPGTILHEQAKADGGIQSSDLRDYSTDTITYIPPGLKGYDMHCLRKKAEVIFYSKRFNRMKCRARYNMPTFLVMLPHLLIAKVKNPSLESCKKCK